MRGAAAGRRAPRAGNARLPGFGRGRRAARQGDARTPRAGTRGAGPVARRGGAPRRASGRRRRRRRRKETEPAGEGGGRAGFRVAATETRRVHGHGVAAGHASRRRGGAPARRRAPRRARAAKRSSAARPATAQPATARERSRLEMETRRGWSPASGATASKWHAMGTHTSAARPHSALPKSPFAPRTNVDSSDSSEGRATRARKKNGVVGGGGGGGGPSLRRAAAEAAGSGAWTRPKLGRAKASAVLAGLTGAPTAVPASASSEKMLVRSLTKALRSLARDPEASADPEALRRRVAAAARRADTRRHSRAGGWYLARRFG